ncbi:serine/threonine protein phosphatase [Paenibacillus tianjinensis]|uniref:Serine/threonine protein phosphatase n=1 Tax=Paenibacillus tianjinensis TaxID=2810347 RepID=A0ABX7LK69_9BACL|nr:serine/threonine protein phosphatase [Paenibacillus tianjinensis]
MRTLVISDIHGCYLQFDAMLKQIKYNPDNDKLILLGDYVDRGLYSKDVVTKVIQLAKDYGVIALKGNHDDLMVDAFRNRGDSLWINNGGIMTTQSYAGYDFLEEGFDWDEHLRMKSLILKNYPNHIDFLENLPLYYEDDKHIYVHAGINPEINDWKQQSEEDFLWIREDFYNNPTRESKTIVFGHTPTIYLHKSNNIWFGKGKHKGKIGIDGGCFHSSGQLNCLEISEDGKYKEHVIRKR